MPVEEAGISSECVAGNNEVAQGEDEEEQHLTMDMSELTEGMQAMEVRRNFKAER